VLRKGIFLTASFLIASLGVVHAKDEGFNGKWVLDKASQQPPNAPVHLETKIKQDNSGVTIESTFAEPADGVVPLVYLGVLTTKMHLAPGGQVEQNAIGPFQMASKTDIDGTQMQTEWTAMVKGDAVQGHWTQRLSDDGKHMTWEIKETSTQGQHSEATLSFVRK
jgi:hypothetical protein